MPDGMNALELGYFPWLPPDLLTGFGTLKMRDRVSFLQNQIVWMQRDLRRLAYDVATVSHWGWDSRIGGITHVEPKR